ncbi:MAG: FIG003003: hypothetical protein [Candidatus Burkholderia crenata]|nr:MAG: FIG003003: hypothetical protein [Candidatus Burkholderia crenata]
MPLRKTSLHPLKHSPGPIRVGCAGWGITDAVAEHFPGDGTHLARYSQMLTCVEINSSFYRPHRADTSLVYFRLHGSPEMYQSSYEYPYLDALALTLHDRAKKAHEVWCIFDNTAAGHAQFNARPKRATVREKADA